MKYILKVKNENEIVSKALNDYPFLNKDYAEKIVHMVIENIDFSFEQQSVNVLQYITEDNLKAFSKIMQDTLFDRINRNTNIDYQINIEDIKPNINENKIHSKYYNSDIISL